MKITLTRRTGLIACAVAALIAFGIAALWTSTPAGVGDKDGAFATKPAYTAVLKAQKAGESVRILAQTTDGKRTGMRIEFKDGRTAFVEFDTANRPVSIKEYFALTDDELKARNAGTTNSGKPGIAAAAPEDMLHQGLTGRKLASITELDVDGKTIKSQRLYRNNGSIKETAVMAADGNLIVTAYFESGSGVERIKVFGKDKNGALISEQVFRADGTGLAERYKKIGYQDGLREFFDTSNVRYRTISYGYSIEVTDYDKDGRTKLSSKSYSYSNVTASTYVAGKLTMDRVYFDGGDAIAVKYYGPDTQTTTMQRWVKLNPSIAPDQVGTVNDGYVLDTVTEYWEGTWNTKRELSYYPGGKYVKTAELRKKEQSYRWGYYTRREYRPDGSLDRIDEFDYGRVKNSVKMPDGQNSERESITGDAAKLTLLLPLLSKNDQTAPKLEVRALTVTID